MNQSNPLILLRGPLIVFSVLSALLAPYLAQLSLHSLGLVFLLAIGLCITFVDVFSCLGESIRISLGQQIDKIVLDDVLKAIFDPETGLIATSMAAFVGSSAMYSLASTDDQRVRLLQSGLWVRDPDVARNVLYEPGGIKFLLPDFLVKWLAKHPATEKEDEVILNHDALDERLVGCTEKSHGSSDDESVTALYEDEKRSFRGDHVFLNYGVNHVEIKNNVDHLGAATVPSDRLFQQSTRSSPAQEESANNPKNDLPSPPMPHEVVGEILMKKARDKISQVWQEIPKYQSSIRMTGATAALLLLLQIRSSRRARDLLSSALSSFTLLGLSSIATASGAMVFAGSWDRRKLSLSSLKESVVSELKQNWKRWLAVLVLFYMRQRQRPSRR